MAASRDKTNRLGITDQCNAVPHWMRITSREVRYEDITPCRSRIGPRVGNGLRGAPVRAGELRQLWELRVCASTSTATSSGAIWPCAWARVCLEGRVLALYRQPVRLGRWAMGSPATTSLAMGARPLGARSAWLSLAGWALALKSLISGHARCTRRLKSCPSNFGRRDIAVPLYDAHGALDVKRWRPARVRWENLRPLLASMEAKARAGGKSVANYVRSRLGRPDRICRPPNLGPSGGRAGPSMGDTPQPGTGSGCILPAGMMLRHCHSGIRGECMPDA